MQTSIRSGLVGLFTLCALSLVAPALEAGQPQAEALKASLRSVPAPEMPAKAAALVAQSKPEEAEAVAVAVVQAAIDLSPATSAEVVGAIARKIKPVAPAVAAAAARQPKAAPFIAKAAAVSAPSYAGQIVAAICKKEPTAYAEVALTVVRALPAAGESVLASLVEAIPALKPFVTWANSKASSSDMVLAYVEPAVKHMAIEKKTPLGIVLRRAPVSVAEAAQFGASSFALSSPENPSSAGLDPKPGDIRVGASGNPPRNHNYSQP